jgi:O-antigen ligase
MAYLYYFLFFFTPIVLYHRTSELFEFNKMVTVYAITALIVGAWISKMIAERKKIFRRTILDIPILIFLASQILSTLTSIDVRTSLLGYYSRYHGGLASSISYSLLYWAYVSNMDRKKTIKTIYSIFISAVLVCTYAVLEHFGIDKDVWIQDVQNRVFSTLGQPNWLAAWIVSITPITFVFTLKDKWENNKERKRAFTVWTALYSLFYLSLLYTKSKSGFLGFIAAYGLFWVGTFWIRRGSWRKYIKQFLLFTTTTLIINALVGYPWGSGLIDRLSDARRADSNQETQQDVQENQKPEFKPRELEVGISTSADIRKIVWRGAVDVWKKYPILGSGVETFAYSYYESRPVEHNLVSEWDFLYNKAHNEYLNIAATTGSVGLIAHFVLVATTFIVFIKKSNLPKSKTAKGERYLFRGANTPLSASNTAGDIFALSFLSGYVSILITNFFGFSVVPVGVHFFLFPALTFTLFVRDQKDSNDKQSIGSIQKTAIAIVGITTLYILFLIGRYWYADTLYAKGVAHNEVGNYVNAKNYLTKATEYSDKEAIFWMELSESTTNIALNLAENNEGELANSLVSEALEQLETAVELSPRNVNILRKAASNYIKLSSFNPVYLVQARDTLEEAVRLAPTEAKLLYNLALTHIRTGNYERGKEILKTTIEMKSNYKNARLAYAILLTEDAEYEEAKRQLKYILENIAPDDKLTQQQLDEIENK